MLMKASDTGRGRAESEGTCSDVYRDECQVQLQCQAGCPLSAAHNLSNVLHSASCASPERRRLTAKSTRPEEYNKSIIKPNMAYEVQVLNSKVCRPH